MTEPALDQPKSIRGHMFKNLPGKLMRGIGIETVKPGVSEPQPPPAMPGQSPTLQFSGVEAVQATVMPEPAPVEPPLINIPEVEIPTAQVAPEVAPVAQSLTNDQSPEEGVSNTDKPITPKDILKSNPTKFIKYEGNVAHVDWKALNQAVLDAALASNPHLLDELDKVA